MTAGRKEFTVLQVTRYIKGLLTDDMILAGLFVKGEISNCKQNSMGHIYFTLKDSEAQINVVMFKSYAEIMPFELRNGMSIVVYGGISIYEKTGQYQLYAELIEPKGVGSLAVAFEQLKSRLFAEGLFDREHKKPLPMYPKRVGIVTSETGAAVHDIVTVAKRRNPSVKLIICPAVVQGDSAPKSIINAINILNREWACDVIIVGRGGGSVEDLRCFNDEGVARAIYRSKIPIVSAVGHETDETIADYAADLRAATPSAAAEIVIPELDLITDEILELKEALHRAMEHALSCYRDAIDNITDGRLAKTLLRQIYDEQIYLSGLKKCLDREMQNTLDKSRNIFENRISILESLSPLSTLKRGYAIVTDNNGDNIKSANDVSVGDEVELGFFDGTVKAKVF